MHASRPRTGTDEVCVSFMKYDIDIEKYYIDSDCLNQNTIKLLDSYIKDYKGVYSRCRNKQGFTDCVVKPQSC